VVGLPAQRLCRWIIGCGVGVLFRAKQALTAIGGLLRLGHYRRRGTYFPGEPYNTMCSLKNNSTLEELNVLGSRVTSC
jgi:hypothetical protein